MNPTVEPLRDLRAQLRRFVGKRVSDRHEAEDIVQDVLVRAQESLHQIESRERIAAWLSRIAANRIIDYYRARRLTEELPEDLAAAAPEDDPVVALAACLPTLAERLPAAYRDALRLSELDGMPQREVARRLGLSLSGAKSRVQRGRAMLRQVVEQCCRVFTVRGAIVDFEPVDGCASRSPCDACKGLRLS